MNLFSITTAHALLRFLERVKGVDVRGHRRTFFNENGREPSNNELVGHIERRSGICEVKIRSMMPMDHIIRAINCGSKGVTVGGFRYVIEGGVVVTVMPSVAKSIMHSGRRPKIDRRERMA